MMETVKSTIFWVMSVHSLIKFTDIVVECTASIFRVEE
jgi:hypothetical protein